MNPKDKMDMARLVKGPSGKASRRSNLVINGVKISREARDLVNSCLFHHGVDTAGPNNDTEDGGFIPPDKFIGAIHELANNARITNDAMVKSLVNSASSLEGVTKEAYDEMLSLAQHAVDQRVSAELTHEALQLLTDKMDMQFKAVLKIKNKIDHLKVDKLADDIDKLAQALSNPLVAKLLGLNEGADHE